MSLATLTGFAATRSQVLALAMRSIKRILRQPQVIVPNLFFPLFFMIINNAALGRATQIPDFPADNFLAFGLAGTVAQAVMLSSTSAGSEVAIDIESGFFERLLASPVNSLAILLGQLAGVAVYGGVLALFFALVVAPFGATLASGPVGYLVLVVVGMLLAISFGAISVALGIKTGSVEAAQGAFPLYFVVIFVSSAFFPTFLMRGAYRRVAEANPVTWLIDAIRDLTLQPLAARPVLVALGVAIGFAVAGLLLAQRALTSRLAAS